MIRHLLVVAAAAVPLLVAVVAGTAGHGPLALAGGVALWALGVGVLAAVVWRETVQPLRELLAELSAGTGHEARWRLRRLRERLEQYRDERQAAAELLGDLSAGLTDGLVVVDRDLRIRLINPAALRFCGWKEVQPGTPLVEVLREPGVLDAVREAVEGRRSEPVLVENSRGIWEARTAPVSRGGAVLLLADVTLTRRAAELRRRFVQDLSHELRSPLTVLRTTVEALEADVNPEDAALLVRQVERITRLAEELHELATIESGELALEAAPVDLVGLAEEVAADLAGAARRSGVRVSVRASGPVTVVSDRRAVRRVLTNLLDNAVKYNREGGEATVSVAPTPGGGALVEVKDTGDGIPPGEVAAVFQRFYRVDRARTPGTGGLGLGLAIVKHLVQRLGGTVELDSREGRGTRVRVTLPPALPTAGLEPDRDRGIPLDS